MIVIAIERFTDLKEGKIRGTGEEFEVTKARFDELQKLGNLVEEVKRTPKKKKGD